MGEKHAEYVQTLVALAELKRRQGSTADALLLFKESADVLQHQDPTFSASEETSHLVMSVLRHSPALVCLHIMMAKHQTWVAEHTFTSLFLLASCTRRRKSAQLCCNSEWMNMQLLVNKSNHCM